MPSEPPLSATPAWPSGRSRRGIRLPRRRRTDRGAIRVAVAARPGGPGAGHRLDARGGLRPAGPSAPGRCPLVPRRDDLQPRRVLPDRPARSAELPGLHAPAPPRPGGHRGEPGPRARRDGPRGRSPPRTPRSSTAGSRPTAGWTSSSWASAATATSASTSRATWRSPTPSGCPRGWSTSIRSPAPTRPGSSARRMRSSPGP